MSSTSLGTPYYISPEIYKKEQYSYSTDIWQLGCFLYELTTLNKPFSGNMVDVIHQVLTKEPAPIPYHYSDFLRILIKAMLQKLPTKRPSIEQILSFKEIYSQYNQLKDKYQQEYTGFKFPCPQLNLYDFSLLNPAHPTPKIFPSNEFVFKPSHQPTVHKKILFARSNSQKTSENNIYNYLEKVKKTIQPNSHPITPQYWNANQGLIQMNKPITPQITSNGIIYSQQCQTNQDQSIDKSSVFQQQSIESPVIGVLDRSQLISRTKQNQLKKHFYSKQICIDLKNFEQLEGKKLSTGRNQKKMPTDKVTQKVFNFAEVLFNPKIPTTPNRKICLINFLKQKIGEEKFQQIKQLFDGKQNAMQIFENESNNIELILNEQKDCIQLVKLLFINERQFKQIKVKQMFESNKNKNSNEQKQSD